MVLYVVAHDRVAYFIVSGFFSNAAITQRVEPPQFQFEILQLENDTSHPSKMMTKADGLTMAASLAAEIQHYYDDSIKDKSTQHE